MVRESYPEANYYDNVKNLLLKRFKMSPEEFRQKIISNKKEFSTSWHNFAFELRNFFEKWIKSLEISNFVELKELIVTDQFK